MRFVIYGAGGVGGVIGAELFRAGKAPVLIARGRHLEVICEAGLRYQTPSTDERLPIEAVAHPAEIALRGDEVFVLTMKSQHTGGALDTLRETLGDRVPVVCCQNGVANERMALRRFETVYAMLVYLPAQLTVPGEVQCHAGLAPGVLDLGRYPRGIDAMAEEIAVELEAVGFSIRPDSTVMRFKYAKLLANLNNALDAVAPGGERAQGLRERMVEEGRACFRAASIDWASDQEVRDRREGSFAFADIPGVPRQGGSSHQSLIRGTGDIEADYLNGEIVLLGRLHGVPTPANAVLQRLAVACALERRPPASVSLEEVERLVEEEADRAAPAGAARRTFS